MDPLKMQSSFTPKGSISSSSQGPWENSHGLNWFVTGLFVVGDLAGGGLVSLPTAMIQSGFWAGLVILGVMICVVTYTAHVLGKSWNILLNRWPEYRQHCRKPYPEIGRRAGGPLVQKVVSVCIDVTQFGIAVVYLLLCSKNIHDFIKAFFGGNVSFCLVILVLAVLLLPVTFLKSPNDFWWAVVIAMITTSLAVVFIVTGSILDYNTCHPHREMPDFRISNYFLAMGTFLFACGGHSAFPTIQHDMRKPHEFTKSAMLAFGIMTCMYMPAAVMGYVTYGDSLRASVINSVQVKWIQQTVNILITAHCLLTLTIVFNPLNQEIEDLFRVPQSFGWQRVAVRSTIMLGVVFVAESLPTFGPLLDLMGGSTLTLTSIVFPALFYLYLSAAEEKRKVEKMDDDETASWRDVLKYTPRVTLVVCALCMLFGICGGAAATYSAIKELSTTQFVSPCYVSIFQKSNSNDTNDGHTVCCGHYGNVTRDPGIECMKWDDKFYG